MITSLKSVLCNMAYWAGSYRWPVWIIAHSKVLYRFRISIPYGQTLTYGEIAGIIARERGLEKMSDQAVGNAVSRNSISLIIPGHRVLGSKGRLTGLLTVCRPVGDFCTNGPIAPPCPVVTCGGGRDNRSRENRRT
ncbi:MAG: methylated-DNA--[protein]-cysteine S-methyltransferase [Candidatus Cryptobacteroides sp.]